MAGGWGEGERGALEGRDGGCAAVMRGAVVEPQATRMLPTRSSRCVPSADSAGNWMQETLTRLMRSFIATHAGILMRNVLEKSRRALRKLRPLRLRMVQRRRLRP